MAEEIADFSGWATKAGLKCADGRTIMPDAFKHQDGVEVPLVWQHQHNSPENVLGKAILHNRPEGVWIDAYFNDTDAGATAKKLVHAGNVKFLSIWANKLVEKAKQVFHGSIREVSLVLAGANPGAVIENVALAHGDGVYDELDDEATITTGLEISLAHADSDDDDNDSDGESLKDVYNTLTDKQKQLFHYMIGQTAELAETPVKHGDDEEEKADDESEDESEDGNDDESDENDSDDESDENDNESKDKTEDNLEHQEGDEMTRNIFEKSEGGVSTKTEGPQLTHDQMRTIWEDAKKPGMTLKESLLAHADEYGITNIELLFPDAQAIDNRPEWITRRMEWVETVLNGTRKLPFSKIKSMSADLTHEEARAKGYIKATMKKEQFFAVAKRETGPKTIYKKQRLDKDDITDITDFDVVAWFWVEMRFMLREEIARAILVGDGREVDDPDKIDEDKIRPIAFDDEFYTDVVHVPANISSGGIIESVLRARKNYKGSGNPDMFVQEDVLTDMLLEKDRLNRRLYNTVGDVAAALRVNSITPVPVMEGVQRDGAEVLAILVNLSDYSVGSTRGGEISTYQQFDMDYNQEKLLIEGRMSGALTKHKTAQVILRGAGTAVGDGADPDTVAGPDVPAFDPDTGVVTIPAQTGVSYFDVDTDEELAAGAQPALAPGDSLAVVARPDEGYYFPHNVNTDWTFTRAEA